MAYYDALAQKWATLSGTTVERLAALDQATAVSGRQAVPIAKVMTYLRTNNLWLQIKAAANGGTSLGAAAAVDLNQDLRIETIDLDLPIVRAMLADLIAKGLLTQAQADALTALGDISVPWWSANGYTAPITQADLDAAGL